MYLLTRATKSSPPNPPAISAIAEHGMYVDTGRLDQLRAVQSQEFDLRKLIRLCEELNMSYANGAYFSVATLTRALMDHVPPIFALGTFVELANNCPGPKSFRKSMQHLEGSARNIADSHLHTPIRAREVLPTVTQVNFRNDLDVLLGEIVRILS